MLPAARWAAVTRQRPGRTPQSAWHWHWDCRWHSWHTTQGGCQATQMEHCTGSGRSSDLHHGTRTRQAALRCCASWAGTWGASPATSLGLPVFMPLVRFQRQPAPAACAVCRHALAHPLVDPDAGQRPQQHHMRTTAATAAKASAARLMPLPQPISTALGTQVQPVPDLLGQLKSMRGRLTAMQGTLLPQLQGQANRMTAGSGKGAGAGPDAGQGRTGR
jgi:hypothetical protein